MPRPITQQPDVAKPAPGESSRVVTDPAELARRAALIARASGKLPPEAEAELRRQELAGRVETARQAWEASKPREGRDRPPRMVNEFDPGPTKRRWEREGRQASDRKAAAAGTRGEGSDRFNGADPAAGSETNTRSATEPEPARLVRHAEPDAERTPRRRGWKLPTKKRRKLRHRDRVPTLEQAAVIFAKDRSWTLERRQRLATRVKRNERIIAHPSGAEAALRKLSLWAQASVRRALRAKRWTLGDEAARRHVAWWATMEEFARPRAWQRPRRVSQVAGMQRFAGIPRFALAVVGWTQTALAICLSGPAYSANGDDPIDVKTVQRHTALAQEFGAVQLVHHNPDAEPELRGAPTEANPRGWPINAYWIPSSPEFHKPGFTGRWIDHTGQPIDLEKALAIELNAKAKRARRLREARAEAKAAAERPAPS